jgi:hypothetical protein
MKPGTQPQLPHLQLSLHVRVRLPPQSSVSPGAHGPWPLQFDQFDHSPVAPLHVCVCVPQFSHDWLEGPEQG